MVDGPVKVCWGGAGPKCKQEGRSRMKVLLDQCFFVLFVSLLCSLKPPVGRGRWPLTLSLVLLEVSSC
ncbi:hypothetical protein ILYODFUR_017961 [Ilyodon furcidens]|uniref:Uncharacterized protein n=1 Tax=Ilyodon furcidens TaxID=33524 RepID=A0ABV0T8X3_9TELE